MCGHRFTMHRLQNGKWNLSSVDLLSVAIEWAASLLLLHSFAPTEQTLLWAMSYHTKRSERNGSRTATAPSRRHPRFSVLRCFLWPPSDPARAFSIFEEARGQRGQSRTKIVKSQDQYFNMRKQTSSKYLVVFWCSYYIIRLISHDNVSADL